jgi:carbonic anhydrase
MDIRQILFLLISVQLLCSGCYQAESNSQKAVSSDIFFYIKTDGTILLKQHSFSCIGDRETSSYSPINVLSKENKEGLHDISVYYQDREKEFTASAQETILDSKLDSVFVQNGKTYKFEEVHFHNYAEHLIDGIGCPIEMHIVNKRVGKGAGENTEWLVIVCLFKIGASNLFIDWFIQKEEEEKHYAELELLNLNNLLDAQLKESSMGYYRYQTILEVPKNEIVEWFVAKRFYEASDNQIHKIHDSL